MGLDNWFMLKTEKSSDEDQSEEKYTYKGLSYGGEELPSPSFQSSIIGGGYFRGKFWSELFDILLDTDGSCYEQEVDHDTLKQWANDLSRVRLRMLEDEGEVLWEKWRNEYISEGRGGGVNYGWASEFSYEDALSVCMAVEWYAQQEDVVLVGWW